MSKSEQKMPDEVDPTPVDQPVQQEKSPIKQDEPPIPVDQSNRDEEGGSEDAEALRQQITRLQERLAELEGETVQPEKTSSAWKKLRQYIFPLLLLLAVALFAVLPGILVARDRWLGLPAWQLFNFDSWCNNEFLCHTALPPYFGSIFIILLLLVVVIFLYKEDRKTGDERQTGFAPISNPDQAGNETLLADSDRLHRTSLGLRIGAVVLAASFSLLALFTGTIHGWGFGLAILAFLGGHLLPEANWQAVWLILKRNGILIFSFILAQLALILFLAGLATAQPFPWALLLVLILTWINLVRFYRQLPPILWVFSLALVCYGVYINRWSFSTIGDEYAFFNRALEIATSQGVGEILANLFNGSYVYGTHPYLSSAIQALSMKLFGLDSFGWRFSNALLSATAVIFYYLFFKKFTSHLVAILIALLLSTSVYLMTFGKIGYNNLQAYFALSVGLWCAGWALQSRSRLAYALLGVCLGMSFYVYPAALYIIPLPVLLVLMFEPPRTKELWKSWGIAGVGLLICMLPLFFQTDYWQTKGMGLIFNNPEITETAQSTALHIFSNFVDAFFSFLYTPQESHLVPVAYADPLSSAFILIGLVLSFKFALQKRFSMYSLVCFLFLLVAVGVSHDRRFPPTTRMFMLLPWLAFFAAEGITWLADKFVSLNITRWTRNGILAVLLIAIAFLNIYQAYSLSLSRNNANQTLEALFLGIVQRLPEFEPTRAKPLTFLFITNHEWGIDGLHMLMQAYPYAASKIQLQEEKLAEPVISEWLQPLIAGRETLVILQPNLNADWQVKLGEQLMNMGKEPCEIKEYTGKDTRFTLWHSADLQGLCAFP
jgi:4-amino-4-deoxy-L-arabinose transferase-like glycosyltransferase